MASPESRVHASTLRPPPTWISPDGLDRPLDQHVLTQFAQTLLRTLAGSVQRYICLTVKRLACVENPFQIIHRFGGPLHRAEVPLGYDARHMFLGGCLDPHGETIEKQQVVRLRLGNDTASHAHDHLLVALNYPLEALALDAVITCLSVERKDFAQANAGVAFDLAVELQEWKPQFSRKRAAQCRLVGAAQSDQRDTPLAIGSFMAEFAHEPENHILELLLLQLFEETSNQPLLDRSFVLVEQLDQRHSQRARHIAQEKHRRVSATGLQLRQIAFRDA